MKAKVIYRDPPREHAEIDILAKGHKCMCNGRQREPYTVWVHETWRERTRRQGELGRPHHLPGSNGYFWNAEHWVLTHSNCRTTGWKARSDWHADKTGCDVGTVLSHTVMLPMLTGGETIPISLKTSHPATRSPGAKQMKHRKSFTSCCRVGWNCLTTVVGSKKRVWYLKVNSSAAQSLLMIISVITVFHFNYFIGYISNTISKSSVKCLRFFMGPCQ